MVNTRTPASSHVDNPALWRRWAWCSLLPVSLLLGACATPFASRDRAQAPAPVVPAAPPTASVPAAPGPTAPPAPIAEVEPEPALVSFADSPRAYRRDGAQHLYRLNEHRVFRGRMPPLLRAVGVMQLELDHRGRIQNLRWMRAPSHVPEVMAEIERTVRQAEPFPAPRRLGGVVYTETWLWDKSGRFQLDTLTEGQRSTL
jgi:periplasmic protein TonB